MLHKSSVTFVLQAEEALIDWAYECYKDKKLDKLVENDEEASNDMKRLERLVIVAIWCIQEDPSLRPLMKRSHRCLRELLKFLCPQVLHCIITRCLQKVVPLSFHSPQLKGKH